MSDWLPIIMFATAFLLILFGYPVAFTLGGVALLFGAFTLGFDFFYALPLRIFGIMNNYVLIAAPLFIFMGITLEKSGIAENLLNSMGKIMGGIRGGLAYAVIIVGALLAASTGIVGATVVTMGLISLPTMLKHNYKPELATGVIAASGTLGQIIPPSVVLVLLGSVLNVSVGHLFLAALIPAVALVLSYLLMVFLFSYLKSDWFPDWKAQKNEPKEKKDLKGLFKSLLLPFILILTVLGSIFAGIASPTEAAAVGAVGALFLAWIQGKLSFSTLKTIGTESTHLSSMVFMIFIGATAFSLVFRGLGGDHLLTELILQNQMSPGTFVLAVMAMVFIAGFFIDFIEIVFIIVPVVAPIFQQLGVDLIWIGILLAVNLQTSFLTPPFGFSLFYLKGVAPSHITTAQLYRGIIPFVIVQLVVMALLLGFPETIEWLPKIMRNE
jgi:tripartite ATP-independent transporter DctM subunit